MGCIVIAMAAATASGAAAPVQATIEGDWTNSANTVEVRVSPCGDALCGHVTWASQAAQDDAFRAGTAQLVGTQVMYEFVPAGTDRWKGTVFVPDMRRTSRAKIIRRGPDQMEVVACELAGLICKKQKWHRASSTNPR